ncbi:MAG: MmcB family DNA repair protein [bacterium]|nr:MmcB family DNA repair protein [bacterium]
MGTSRPVRADEILGALQRETPDDHVFFAAVKTGPTQLGGTQLRVLDAVWLRRSWTRPWITGFEVKVSRGDYTRDEKWVEYLEVCHRFYFVAPPDVISRDELPPAVGLRIYDPATSRLSTRRAAPVRPVDLPASLLWYLIISRLEPDRHPFYRTRRELAEAYLRGGREAQRQIGERLGTRLAQDVELLAARVQDLERDLSRAEQAKARLEEVQTVARTHGIPTWPEDRFAETLNERLAGVNDGRQMVQRFARAMARDLRHVLERAERAQGEERECS